jgi:hypothetical protein
VVTALKKVVALAYHKFHYVHRLQRLVVSLSPTVLQSGSLLRRRSSRREVTLDTLNTPCLHTCQSSPPPQLPITLPSTRAAAQNRVRHHTQRHSIIATHISSIIPCTCSHRRSHSHNASGTSGRSTPYSVYSLRSSRAPLLTGSTNRRAANAIAIRFQCHAKHSTPVLTCKLLLSTIRPAASLRPCIPLRRREQQMTISINILNFTSAHRKAPQADPCSCAGTPPPPQGEAPCLPHCIPSAPHTRPPRQRVLSIQFRPPPFAYTVH